MHTNAISTLPPVRPLVSHRIWRGFSAIRSFLTRRARIESDAGADAAEAIGAVERLLALMEGQFQTLSEDLIECFTRSKTVARDAAAIPGMLDQGEGSSAAIALQEILDLAGGMHSRCGEASRLLREVCNSASRLGKGIASRRQFLTTFQVMQTMSQIEIARLNGGGSDFGALGEEMSALAVRIREETARIGDITRALGLSACQAATRAQAIETAEETSLPELSAGARRGLEALLASRAAGAQASSTVAERYANVSAAVEQLISSVQSHDIVRQQLEHVVESLRPIASGDVTGAARNATLQVSHICHARESLVNAADSIVSSLQQIASNVEAIVTETNGLLGNGEGTAPEGAGNDGPEQKGAHSSELERDIEGVLQALARFQASEANIAAAAASVLSGIEAIAGSVGEVQGIGVRMQRIALNSSIQSSQLGEVGAPLSVLADLARTLASDAEEWAETVSRDLGFIAAHGDALSAIASQAAAGGASQLTEAAQRMRNVLATLNNLDLRGGESIGAVEKQALALQARIEAVRKTITIQERAGALADESVGSLRRTIAATTGADPDPADLAEVAARYTMESERKIHHQLAETMQAPVLSAAGPEAENIELF